MALLENISKRSNLWFLNFAQIGAVVNDNIYKLVMVFILIELFGPPSASKVLSAAGAVYVIPFLLFSSAAGILADRHSKKWIIVVLKIAEVVIFAASLLAVSFTQSILGPFTLYLLLFFLATHSAIFGPSKYSIIPELVSLENVPKANGLITSCTYLAIIVGTFLASFLSEVFNRHYIDVMLICLCFALFGLLSALCIRSTPKQGSTRKINVFFLKEIYITLRGCRSQPHLLVVLASSAFFLFVGSYTQLNIIPYTLQGLHMSEIYGGYLFLCTAFGIAIGSFYIGKTLKKPVNLWIPFASCVGLAFFFLILSIFSGFISIVILFLVFLGFAGGMFVVPLDTFVQLACSNETRGQVIAAGNFLGFCGVLISSFLLYFLSNTLGLSAMAGFAVMAFLTFVWAIFLFLRFSDFTLPVAVKTFLNPSLNLELADISLLDAHSLTPLVLLDGSFRKCGLISAIAPHYHFLFLEKKNLFLPFLYSFHRFSNEEKALSLAKAKPVCFVVYGKTIPPFLPKKCMKVEVVPPENQKGPTIIRIY